MKSAIYLEDGTTQVVLTPENEWERNALRMIESSGEVSKFWGSFYECQGGWIRQNPAEIGGFYNSRIKDDASLIFRIDKGTKIPDRSEGSL